MCTNIGHVSAVLPSCLTANIVEYVVWVVRWKKEQCVGQALPPICQYIADDSRFPPAAHTSFHRVKNTSYKAFVCPCQPSIYAYNVMAFTIPAVTLLASIICWFGCAPVGIPGPFCRWKALLRCTCKAFLSAMKVLQAERRCYLAGRNLRTRKGLVFGLLMKCEVVFLPLSRSV
jgi:hypothetical protein